MSQMTTTREKPTEDVGKRMKNKVESCRIVMKEEMRRLYGVGNLRTDKYQTSACIISFPKRYVSEFGLKKGDIFVYSFVKENPLTLQLRKIELPGDDE